MILGLGLFTPLALAGSILYITHHIIVKTNLFLVSGAVHRLHGSYQLKNLGGVYRTSPVLAALFLVPALSLAGLPPLSGFFAKLSLVMAGLDAEQYFIVGVALLVGILTLFSMTKIWAEVFWKPAPAQEEQDAAIAAGGRTARRALVGPIVALATVTIIIGLGAEPFFALSTRAAGQLLNPSEYIEAVLRGMP
jgi:multicomponent Na+:H+ antiporter subunit D